MLVILAFSATLPPYIVSAPFRLMFEPMVMVPVLLLGPMVRFLPAVAELIAVLTVTLKVVVLPTMVNDPLFKAVVIAETFTVEFAVTVKVPELIDQPDKELLAVEMVKVCPAALPMTHTEVSMHNTDLIPFV